MARRVYTDDDRERARVAWEQTGRSLRGASRETGIPLATIQGWAAIWEDPPPAPLAPREVYEAVYEDVRTSKKGEAIVAAWDAAKAAFIRVAELAPGATDIQRVATAAGIAVDKAALLSGEATERREDRSAHYHHIKIADEPERLQTIARILEEVGALADPPDDAVHPAGPDAPAGGVSAADPA